MTNSINQVKIQSGPNPWAASVYVEWNWKDLGLSRRKRSRIVRKAIKDLELETDYSMRYDSILDITILCFRDKATASSVYLELG